MKLIPLIATVFAPFLIGCQSVTTTNDSEISKTTGKITQNILRQSNEIVAMKSDDYDSAVESSVDSELLGRISNLRKQIWIAKEESQGSDVSTFEIDTIPEDLILLRRKIPSQQAIVRWDSFEGNTSVVVREKVDSDGRSEGYEGEVLLIFHKPFQSFRLKDVIFRRYKGVPEWRLSDYLSDQQKKIESLRQRLRT